MKRVSFKVAKAIKEAGYPQEWHDTEYYYNASGELKYCDDYEGNNHEDIMYYQRLAIPAPTYLEVWLWLWREKNINLSAIYWNSDKSWHIAGFIKDKFNDPEEAIIAAIEYLVDNELLK